MEPAVPAAMTRCEDFVQVSDDDVVAALGHAGTTTVTQREQPTEGRDARV